MVKRTHNNKKERERERKKIMTTKAGESSFKVQKDKIKKMKKEVLVQHTNKK